MSYIVADHGRNTLKHSSYINLSTCKTTTKALARNDSKVLKNKSKQPGCQCHLSTNMTGWIWKFCQPSALDSQKKKIITTKRRSSNSRFCCEQHKTAYSLFQSFVVTLNLVLFLGCACWSNISETYCFMFLSWKGWSAVFSLPLKRNKANRQIRTNERGMFQQFLNWLNNYRLHSLLWSFTALC